MSTSIDISTNDIEIIPADSVAVETGQKDVCVQPYTEVEVTGFTKEYTIIGDAIFASQNVGEAPQWLSSIIDSVIGAALDSSLTDLAQAQRGLIDALEALGIANNNYTEMVNIDARVDSAVSTRLSALNANIENANATIAELQITKASADEASAIALDIVSASLNNTDAGTIGGTVSQLNSSISTLADSVSSARTLVESRYGELNESIADLEISVNTAIDSVASAFAYDSVLKVGGNYYKTGFGLKANVTTDGAGTVVDPFTSEFWIDATRFKFTNSNATGGVSPFTIDATGTDPNITFAGRVSFTNPAEDLVGAINNGTTTISGSKITTGSITADQIDTQNLHVASAADFTGDLQSTHFETGVQGWKLSKSGSIELNDALIRGTLATVRIATNDPRIKSTRNSVYGPITSFWYDFQVYTDGGSSQSVVNLARFYLPLSYNVSETKISTEHNKLIEVSGLVQFRNSTWTLQYSTSSNPTWRQVPDAPTIINTIQDAKIYPFTFFIRIFGTGGIVNPLQDTWIYFRYARTAAYDNNPRINSFRISMRYQNL